MSGFLDLDEMFSEEALKEKIKRIRRRKSEKGILASLFGEDWPSSIMRARKVLRILLEESDGAAARKSGNDTQSPAILEILDKLPKDLRHSTQSSGLGSEKALSVFAQNIGRTMVILYSEPGQTVYDPFAGHNSRMELCVKAGRNYIGCDLNAEFMAFNHKRAAILRDRHPGTTITLHECDARRPPVSDESADFTITSPPYWDVEDYGDAPGQLARLPGGYVGFLKGLGRAMRENYRILRPGSFAAYFVNDFRRKGVFYLFHLDVVRLGRKAGFVPHDILISDLGKGIRDCFLAQTVQTKILPKRHEYGLVFRKPKGSR